MFKKISAIKKKLKWIDPFTYVDMFIIPRVHALPSVLQWASFALSFVVLVALISFVLGATPIFFVVIAAFYAYLLFFEREEAVDWGIYLLSAFVFAWAIYSILGIALGTHAPMVIVVSGSMEPLYYRGDVILLQGTNFDQLTGQEVTLNQPLAESPLESFAEPHYTSGSNGVQVSTVTFNNDSTIPITKEGSIIVYYSPLLQQPIIHRVVTKIDALDGQYVLTKGDSIYNNTLDQDCGTVRYNVPEKSCITLYPVKTEEIQGKAFFKVPIVGCVKLWLFDNIGSLIATGKLPHTFRRVC